MSKTVATNVVLVSVNHVSDDEVEEILEEKGYDMLQEYADSLQEQVEAHIGGRVFGAADEIPILSVESTVYEDFDDAEAEKLVER